ncbi:MAG TPA: hypothetical protein VIE44_11730 [Methylomirabilota bacterium]|jgi:hypothetical protein
MRHTTLATAVVALALCLSACSSTKGVPPIRSEFMDIPLPGGLQYLPEQSAVIESETVRAARLMYSSNFEPGSLVLSIQEGLLGNGWRLTRTTSFPNLGTIQLYEKGESSLQVRIWEGGAFSGSTYVELSGTRALPRTRTTAATQ